MERSHFDGTVLQHFGYSLLAGMFTAITLGIGAPWAYCGLHRWEVKHTIIESKRLEFNGKGLQLFLLCLKLIFLPVLILFGAGLLLYPLAKTKIGSVIGGLIALALLILFIFYGSFVFIQLKKWIIGHTSFQIHVLPGVSESVLQPTQAYNQPAPTPQPVPQWESESTWWDKIEKFMPLIYIVETVVVLAVTWGILSMIFK